MSQLRKLLVATDHSAPAERACAVGIDWARRFGAELHWVHAVEHLSSVTPPRAEPLLTSYVEQARRLGAERLELQAEQAREQGVESELHVIDAPVADGVVRLAGQLGVDCVLVGTHGYTGLRHLVLGSVAEKILRRAPCRVLVVRGESSPAQPGVVVFGDDLTLRSQHPREDAVALAGSLGARLEVVHALDLAIPFLSSLEIAVPNRAFDEAFAAAREKLDALARQTPECEIRNVLVSEHPADAICDAAGKAQAGLAVVGSHSRHGIQDVLLGSVAERVARHAPCSVLVTR